MDSKKEDELPYYILLNGNYSSELSKLVNQFIDSGYYELYGFPYTSNGICYQAVVKKDNER